MKIIGDTTYFTDDEWPMCIVNGCPNRCCMRLNSEKCYPHSFGLPHDIFTQQTKKKDPENVLQKQHK